MAKLALHTTALAIAILAPATLAQPFKISGPDKASLVAALDEQKYGAVTSLLISQDGEIVFEHYADGFDATSLHNTRSVGKAVTGMLAGIAVARGKISGAEAPIAPFFKDLQPFHNPDPRKQAITLKDLLTMSSALECDDWNQFSRGNEERMYIVEDWSAFFWNLPIKGRPSWEMAENPRFDRLFSYCTAGAQLVGETVQRATGQDIAAFAQAHLFEPLGVTSAKWNRASTGTAHMGGGLELTSRDWLKLAQLFAAGGRAGEKQVLPREWVRQSLTPVTDVQDGMGYGYFVWLPEKQLEGKPVLVAMVSGTGGNRIYALPERGVALVITKNAFRDREAHQTSDALFDQEILACLEATP